MKEPLEPHSTRRRRSSGSTWKGKITAVRAGELQARSNPWQKKSLQHAMASDVPHSLPPSLPSLPNKLQSCSRGWRPTGATAHLQAGKRLRCAEVLAPHNAARCMAGGRAVSVTMLCHTGQGRQRKQAPLSDSTLSPRSPTRSLR